MTDTAIQTSTLPQLEIEIKFYLNQTAQSIIEVGKRLIAAKELVPHGDWLSWLEHNFQLKKSMANNFMQIASRFGGNFHLNGNLNQTQLVTLLALPAEDTEKFIEEKLAEGKAVADMTIKQLREEIKSWKQQAQDTENNSAAEIQRLQKIQSSLNDTLAGTRKNIDKLIIEKNFLEKQLKESKKPETITVEVEVPPKDYQEIKESNWKMSSDLDKKESELQTALKNLADIQDKLNSVNKTVEKLKKANERLERKQFELKAEIPSDALKLFCADIRDGLPQIADNSVDVIITDPPYSKEYLPLYADLSKVASRILKDGGSLVCMVGQSYLPEVINKLSQFLTYHWTMCYLTPGGQSPQLFQKKVNSFWKPVLWFVKGKYQGDWLGDVLKSPINNNDKRFHEWGQSVGGMTDIVERFTDPNQLIVDPFLGGGTTGIAAVIKGRKFIGVDINQSCLDTTEKRIAEVYQNVRS